jgi:hypothetical protein
MQKPIDYHYLSTLTKPEFSGAELVTRELGALIDRLEGFEELTHGQ